MRSNNPKYSKSWATKEEEVSLADKVEFVRWINFGLAKGGGSKPKPKTAISALPGCRRSNRNSDLEVGDDTVVSSKEIQVESEVVASASSF